MTMRAAVYIGLAYTACLLVWTLGTLALGAVEQAGARGVTGFLITQYIVVLVAVPWLTHGSTVVAAAQKIVLAIAVSWPALLLLVQLTHVSIARIAGAELALLGLGLVVHALARLTQRAGASWQGLATTTLQLACALAIWRVSDLWTGWVTA